MKTYTLKVVEIRNETDDTVTLCFKQPSLKKIKYKAGQYLTLIFRVNGRRYLRPYSFSSAPLSDSMLEVTIKRIKDGIVSNYVHDFIKTGDSVEVLPPMGDFVFPEEFDACSHVFLWGAGSGITPLFAIAKQLIIERPDVMVTLAYGNSNAKNTIFLESIESLKAQHTAQFRVFYFHSQNVSDEQFAYPGRINRDSAFKIFSGAPAETSTHFICGPLGLKEMMLNILEEKNIPSRSIYFEDFEIIKNPDDFKDIETKIITLSFQQRKYELQVIKGKSILESALDAGIELPYSCQTGDCSTCVAKLNFGEIKMIGLSHERHDLASDHFLLCCSYPITSDINIEI